MTIWAKRADSRLSKPRSEEEKMKNEKDFRATVRNVLTSKTFSLIVLLAVVFIVFSILTDGGFIRPRNIKNFINSISVVSLLTIGAGCLLISGQLDLSAGSIGTLVGVVFALLVDENLLGLPIIVGAILSLILAAGIGAVNALFINRFKTPAFITTMAIALICQGVTYVLTGAKSPMIYNDTFNAIGTKSIFDGYLPISVIIAIVFFIIYGIMLSKTKFGKTIYLVGGNPTASYLTGINPVKTSFILFVNSAVMGGLAGLLLASRMKAGTTQGLNSSQFAGMTAAILGGISFGGGSGGMLGAFLGLILLSAFNNGLTSVGMDSYWQTTASGLLLIVALSLDILSNRQRLMSGKRETKRPDKTRKDVPAGGES